MDRKEFMPEIDWDHEELNGHIAWLAAFITFMVFATFFLGCMP